MSTAARPFRLRSTRVPTIVEQALCVRLWDWSETSQTVSLLGRQSGLFRGLAKGSKREKSPFSGGFEILTAGEVIAIVKSTGTLANVTSWDLQEVFPIVRRSLPSFRAAMYMTDLAQHLIHEHDPHPGMFDALLNGWRCLSHGGPEEALLRFQWSALDEAGYKPELTRDVIGGNAIPLDQRVLAFSPNLGGFTAEVERAQASGPVWRVRPETIAAFERLATSATSVASIPGENADAAMMRANRLLASYARYVLGRELPSMRLCFGPENLA